MPEEVDNVWQGGGGAAGEVLRAVFSWLSGAELWAAAHVCRAWYAAADSRVWRRALLPHAAPAHLAALRRARAAAALNSADNVTGESWAAWSWRREYCLKAARWRLEGRELAAGGAAVTHAALSHAGDRLALAADDASLTVWARASRCVQWTPSWRRSERARGWAAALATSWAPDDARLLLAGPLLLADRWELLVLKFDEGGDARAEVRAECGSGGGCWAGPAAFLSLSLGLLAPARAVTTVWLNAADQGVQSEFSGVRTPVLRVYNEAAAHITHVLVAEVPAHELELLESQSPEERAVAAESPVGDARCLRADYWRATLPIRAEQYERAVVAAVGVAGGMRGSACALAVWALRSRAPPPMFVRTSLAERVHAHRQAQLAANPAAPAAPEPPPSERDLRALCTPPLATCRLPSAILGVELHPNGGCVWAVCGAGAHCASLPALRPLLRVPLGARAAPATPPYVLRPAVCDDFLVTPAGQGSGDVVVVAARSGARGAALPHAEPPVATLLPAAPTRLMVLAEQAHGAHARAAVHTAHTHTAMGSRPAGMRGFTRLLIAAMERRKDSSSARLILHRTAAGGAMRTGCDTAAAPPCAPCRAPAQPACRSPARAALRGQRVVCRPPPHPARPPCAAAPPPCPLACDRHSQNNSGGFLKEIQCSGDAPARCGDSMDRVAQRIAAARLARRQEYEREVAARAAEPLAGPAAPSVCRLPAGREVVRATDGRDYVVLPPLPRSPPLCRNDEKSSSVELDPAKGCAINRSSHVDPCAHRPRLLLEIDRSEVTVTARPPIPSRKTPLDSIPNSAQYRQDESVLESPKKCCKGSAPRPLSDWCSSRPKIEPQRPDCVQPSLVERIRRRSHDSTEDVRNFHTASSLLSQNVKSTERSEIGEVAAKVKADADKLNKMLNERNKLREAGRGRHTNREQTEEACASGQLELRAPASGAGVRVRVSLLPGTPPAAGGACPVSPDGGQQDPTSTYYGKCDHWLSIKNIQKKLTGCRKDSPPIKNIGDDKNMSQNPPTIGVNLGGGASPCARNATTKRSPCEQQQQPSDSPCHTKQKPKPPPCCGAPPTSRCSAHITQRLPHGSIII